MLSVGASAPQEFEMGQHAIMRGGQSILLHFNRV